MLLRDGFVFERGEDAFENPFAGVAAGPGQKLSFGRHFNSNFLFQVGDRFQCRHRVGPNK